MTEAAKILRNYVKFDLLGDLSDTRVLEVNSGWWGGVGDISGGIFIAQFLTGI